MKVNIEFENNDIQEFLEFNNESVKNIVDALQFKKYKQIIEEIDSEIIRPLRRYKYSINGVAMEGMNKENLMDAIVGAFEGIIRSHEEDC